MTNLEFLKNYKEQFSKQSPPKIGQRKMFPEKMITDKMCGQPLERQDQVQARDAQKLKNYGGINKINLIKNNIYNIKGYPEADNSQKNPNKSFENIYFAKVSGLKNMESSEEESLERQQRQRKRIVHLYSASGNKPNPHNQSCGDIQQVSPRIQSLKSFQENNPQTRISDFYRQPSKESGKIQGFTPVKQHKRIIQLSSGRKHFEDQANCDTTIVQLLGKTSETGFLKDQMGKRILKDETLADSFNHLFQQGVTNSDPFGGHHKHRQASEDKYQFRNVITGSNIPAPKAEGVAMIKTKQLRSCSLSNGNIIQEKSKTGIKIRESSSQSKERVMGWINEDTDKKRNESEQKKTNKFSKTDYSSNIFFREGLKTRAEGSIGERQISKKNTERNILLYNSDNIRQTFDPKFTPQKKSIIGQGNSTNRTNSCKLQNMEHNKSQVIQALLIQPSSLGNQQQKAQDFVTQIFSMTRERPNSKMLSNERNKSPITYDLLKNETMGTPHRFLLADSSNKISSRHQNNHFSESFSLNTRFSTSKQFS